MSDPEEEPAENECTDRKQRLGKLIDKGIECKQTLKERSTKDSLEIISNIMQECNDIRMEGKVEDRIGHTTEVVMDAHILTFGYKLVKNMIGSISQFNEQAYASAILKIVKEDGSEWDKIADIACKFAHTVRVKSSMLGAIESKPKLSVTKERQKRKKVTSVEAVPETLQKLERQDNTHLKVNIAHTQIGNYLRENNVESVPYYKLIIDPTNFMNTVENAFQVSFMVKEGSVMVFKGMDGYPGVRLKNVADNVGSSQTICTLNTELCKKFIEMYNIKEPIMKLFTEP